MKRIALSFLPVFFISVVACSPPDTRQEPPSMDPTLSLDAAGEEYVKLALAMGQHDPDFVDAYYGPPEWKEEMEAANKSLVEIRSEAGSLLAKTTEIEGGDDMTQLRRKHLVRQLEAMIGRFDVLEGKPMTFDQESQVLYDAIAPSHEEAYFEERLADLDEALPGSGSVQERYEAYREQFVVPLDKLDTVLQRAIEGCRTRTLAHMQLPEAESFTIEYVTDKPWSGYNWYQGDFKSLIQINTSLPIHIDRILHLACHEGYPGHHVYNILIEKNLVKDHGWKEFTLYPLFSSQSLIAEGTANYGTDLAFPGHERATWEQENIFPLAGLEASLAADYYRILELKEKLDYAGNEAARRYLDGNISADEAKKWMETYSLMTPERAKQRLGFIEKYRAYVINYNLGKDLVRTHVEALAGEDREKRWKVFEELLSSPILPSELKRHDR